MTEIMLPEIFKKLPWQCRQIMSCSAKKERRRKNKRKYLPNFEFTQKRHVFFLFKVAFFQLKPILKVIWFGSFVPSQMRAAATTTMMKKKICDLYVRLKQRRKNQPIYSHDRCSKVRLMNELVTE